MQTQYNDPKGQIGATKAPLGLVPPHAMEQTAWVHKLGADKYGPWNWRETGVCASTYVNAILRHLNAWRDGEDLDPESGISHLAHVACSANILMDAGYCGKLQDDRNKAQKHVGGGMSYEEDWGALDEEDPKISLFSKLKAAVDSATFDREKFYRTLEKGDTVEEGDEHRFINDWYPAPKDVIGAPVSGMVEWRRKITNCDLWGALDELAEEDALAEFVEDMWHDLDKDIKADWDWLFDEEEKEENPYAKRIKDFLHSLNGDEHRVLDKGEILKDGDEVYVGFGDWMTLYIPHWIQQTVNDGTYRRKLITNCDLKERQSCPECDALASYGSNDGPCDYHKNKTCDSKPEPQLKVADYDLKEECKCGRRYVYHWLYGWICEDCDLKLSDYYP